MNTVKKMQVVAEAIPAVLRQNDNWVCWRMEEKDGERKKIPISPKTGQRSDVTQMGDCASFTAALEASSRYGCDGVGMAFFPDEGVCGIDLDKCRDADTGVIEPWAVRIISKVKSYTEVSQSGTGVHIIVNATLKGPKRRKGGVEMYDRDRYFIMTGKRLDGTPGTVENRQHEVDWLYDDTFGASSVDDTKPTVAAERCTLTNEEIVKRASEAGNGKKFKLLYDGDWESAGEYTSQSEADAALLGVIGFWTGYDKDASFRVFESSGLMRDKWREREEYRDATWNLVAKAGDSGQSVGSTGDMASEDNKERWRLPEPADVSKWICVQLPPPDPILNDCIDKGTKVVVVGSSKVGKTFVVLDFSLALATGQTQWLGWVIPKPRRVLVVNMEVAENAAQNRIRDIMMGRGYDVDKLESRLHIVNGRGVEANKQTFMQLMEMVRRLGIEVVIMDPFYKFLEGDENSAEDVKPVLRLFDRVCEKTGATLVYVTHTAKGVAGDRQTIDQAVGSGVIARDFDTMISIVDHETPGYYVMSQIARNYRPADDFVITRNAETDVFEVCPEIAPTKKTSRTPKAPTVTNEETEDKIVRMMKAKGGPLTTTAFLTMLTTDPKVKMAQKKATAMKAGLIASGKLAEYLEKRKQGFKYIGLPGQIEEWARKDEEEHKKKSGD